MTKRKRIKVSINAQIVTSSDKKRAFYINEMNINLGIDTRYHRPYIKIFGIIQYIKDSEVKSYIEHGATIYYE